MPKKIDMIGKKYGRLLVLEKTDKKSSNFSYIYKCLCDCGKEFEVSSCKLRSGHTKSCGCYRKEYMLNKQKKHNKIEIEGDIAKIYFFNTDRYAIIDSEDVYKVKDYCWSDAKDKYYPNACVNGKHTDLHRLILPNNDKRFVTDHINRNPLDNRKCNLRIVTQCVNMQNIGLTVTNTSGYKNISYLTTRSVYVVSIARNHKKHYVGSYRDLETAVQKLEEYKKEHNL